MYASTAAVSAAANYMPTVLLLADVSCDQWPACDFSMATIC